MALKVVSSMKQNNALISTALLSAIFDEKKQDNISLLIPFIIKIIYENPQIQEEEIGNKMVELFAFYNFPRAIVRIIINRLRKQGIVNREDNRLIFKKNITNVVENFDKRMEKAKKGIDEIIRSMMEYFKAEANLKMSYLDCRNSLAIFLDKNGYLLYEDINNSTRIKNKDKVQYHIGLFIKKHKQQEDIIYKNLVDIIEGSLLANAIYVNIENDNKNNLENLTCYFDTPFMLRVLEFKDPKDNKSALELVELLKEQKVKIKCFKHNYDEIENILEEFIRNYGKLQEKTLENLVIKNYSETELRGILTSLEELFKELNIEITDIPDYKKEEYKHVIDEKKLQENLERLYSDEKKNIRIIENDVASISAIMRIRKGKEYRKMEECPAIFVTTNNDIRRETNHLLNLDEIFKISPVISDIDLTAVLWLKSLSTHKNIPELKLTENALAALKPTTSIKNRFNESVQKLKSNKTQITTTQLHNLLCSNYYSENLMDAINGDLNKINPNLILKTYESTLEENKIIERKSKLLEEKNDELLNKLMEKEQHDKKYKDNIYSIYEKRENTIKTITKYSEKIIEILFCCLLCYITFKYTNAKDASGIVKALLTLTTIYTIISTFFPVSIFAIFNIVFNWINSKLFLCVHNIMTSKAEEEIDKILKV